MRYRGREPPLPIVAVCIRQTKQMHSIAKFQSYLQQGDQDQELQRLFHQ
jgi:hypothetical protein